MRFVLTIGFWAGLSLMASAAPWDSVSTIDAQDHVPPATLRHIQMQRGGTSDTLQTLEGLGISVAAQGLGDISAMAVSTDGTLYASDRKSGRIWALPDRGLDGAIDQRRPLPKRFDNPTGLAVIGKTLYVADKQAVWKLSPGQDASVLASLKNANSRGDMHPLTDAQDGTHILLGLTTHDDIYRVLKINIETGHAELAAQGSGHMKALAKRQNAQGWVSVNNYMGPLENTAALNFNPAQSIAAIALPGQFTMPQNWPPQLKDHIIASQAGPQAMRLIAIPTEFGQSSGQIRVLADGFLSKTGRSAWGVPGPIVMDKRGLFFADSHNGLIWKLSPKASVPEPMAEPVITIVDTDTIKKEISQTPPQKSTLLKGSNIEGSQLGKASTLGPASTLEVGSTIIEAYDKAKAEEQAKKDKEKAEKKNRN